ncbi:CDP-diacylglycerol--serine O-phosphatidyltransferase [Desulfuribacillus stibiiarsenatis]|uniref:CDP-diacylglycerol--serine O-phosphatidyltransferase n=1 Tax=Desulfuribacillus stibiiarsenatis TaxID=1390249 RepID=A0A1E5L823_9FIRM|nr:CDP-diacylglycerol--serine O-phosphatidyltransferase [Desulfuribacillus stibiiarsenatis]OEH86300.1 CDP-diacylglycerol--serine O-phosphatidyltransferase [Desulfuribacillus stibiiarsenatis]
MQVIKAVPSVFTVGNLFIGILSIILAFQGQVEYAAIMVVIGMLLDGLDGRMARMLNAQSEFGKELDSLSDIISFGVAPAFIMYVVILQDYSYLGWIITAVFPICGALRLARFNVQEGAPGYFIGLPITAAGGILATLTLYIDSLHPLVLTAGMLGLSYLMVSNVHYPSFKKLGIPKFVYWISAILVLVILIVSMFYPTQVNKILFVPLAVYAFYGLKKNVRIFGKKKKVPGEIRNNY